MSVALKPSLIAQAAEEGFSLTRITTPDAIPEHAERLQYFLENGHHGTMDWMDRRSEWRGDPAALWPAAKSVIMLGESYTPDHNPLEVLDHPDRAAISVYAQNRDYHDLVKKRLKRLGRWVIERYGGEIKVFVDTAPVPEKPLGAAAGLGWQGKHTNLVSRALGNWFFIGSIFTTLDIEPDKAEVNHCGSCRACLDICPTDAFPAPYQLDARRCISYLTIEYDGPVEEGLRVKMGNRIYGCDDCLAVCPWNKFAAEAQEAGYHARTELRAPKLADLAELDDASFRTLFTKSPIKRIGVNRFLRNVGYAIGNSGDRSLTPAAALLAAHEDAVVADAGSWALGRLQ
ncbi:MAG: tRNA epoxyqueuosine(34) reductase QueG [Pseudomonadota bacterium]